MLHPDATTPNYRIDTCCSPIPGDDVLGFVDEEEHVVVHKVSCPEAMRLKSAFGSRLVATEWGGTATAFSATVGIEGIDRRGVLAEIAADVSSHPNTDIRSLTVTAEKEVFNCRLTVQLDNLSTLHSVCSSLKKIKGVKYVKRLS